MEGAAGIMTTRPKTMAGKNASRKNELRRILEDRRREIAHEVQGRIRDVRGDCNGAREVLDEGESSEVDVQDEIEFALIQMKAETLHKIDTALRRLDEGAYGNCYECGEEIDKARLRALPFAVRCKNCEEALEMDEQRDRMMAQRRGSSALFAGMIN
jgi:DnaK suppressor protein